MPREKDSTPRQTSAIQPAVPSREARPRRGIAPWLAGGSDAWLRGLGRRELLGVLALYLAVNLGTAILFWTNGAGGRGAGIAGFPLDDGWIHLVYARSLATHLRPEYNPGQLEAGMTSPLWVVLNAVLYWPGRALGLNPTASPKFLSLLFGTATAVLLHLVVRWRGGSVAAALAAGLLLSVDSRWCFSRASGMEVTLFAFLALLGTAALALRRDLLLGAAVGLACLARPEGLLLAAVALPVGLVVAEREERGWRAWVEILAPAVLLFGAFMIYNLHVTGRPFPNTFYVKAQTASMLRRDNLVTILRAHFLGADFFRSRIGLLFYAAGAVALLRRKTLENLALVAFPWVYLLSVSVTHTIQQDWPFYWSRYLHPIYPFFVLPVFVGLEWSGRTLGSRLRLAVPRQVSVAVVALVWLATAWPALRALHGQAELFSRNCGDIQRGNVEVGVWLRDHTRPEDGVATIDAGAIRYFSDRRVLDLIGLNDHVLARKHGGLEILRDEIERFRPAWFVLFTRDFADLIRTLHLEVVHTVAGDRPYSICDCPSQAVVGVFRAPWVEPH